MGWGRDGDRMGIVYHIEGTNDIACVASVSARFGSKELQGDKWCE